jgi:hypothetical protein
MSRERETQGWPGTRLAEGDASLIEIAGNCTLEGSRDYAAVSIAPNEALPGSKSAPVWPLHLRNLNALLATPMKQPPPSGGEFGRLTAIYQWIALPGLRQVEERFELFELF